MLNRCHGSVFTKPLPSKLFWIRYSSFQPLCHSILLDLTKPDCIIFHRFSTISHGVRNSHVAHKRTLITFMWHMWNLKLSPHRQAIKFRTTGLQKIWQFYFHLNVREMVTSKGYVQKLTAIPNQYFLSRRIIYKFNYFTASSTLILIYTKIETYRYVRPLTILQVLTSINQH